MYEYVTSELPQLIHVRIASTYRNAPHNVFLQHQIHSSLLHSHPCVPLHPVSRIMNQRIHLTLEVLPCIRAGIDIRPLDGRSRCPHLCPEKSGEIPGKIPARLPPCRVLPSLACSLYLLSLLSRTRSTAPGITFPFSIAADLSLSSPLAALLHRTSS